MVQIMLHNVTVYFLKLPTRILSCILKGNNGYLWVP